MRIQYLLVLALVPSLFAQNNGQLVKQTENQVNNTNKSDIVSNVQNVQNPVLQNTNQQIVQTTSNNEQISQQSNNAQSSVQQNSTVNNNQNNVQQNIPEANLKNIKERCEPIINLVLGKIPEKSVSIDESYDGFPSTIYKILKENNIIDYDAIEPLWTEIISKYKPEIDNLNKQLEEYATNNNLPKYSPTKIKEVVNHFLDYYYPNKSNKYIDAINSSAEFTSFVKNYIEFSEITTNSVKKQIHPNDANIIFNKVFMENKQKILDKFNTLKNAALDSCSDIYLNNGVIPMYLVPLFMSDFEQTINNINTIEDLKQFVSSEIAKNPVDYIMKKDDAIYPKLIKNNPNENTELTNYIDYSVYCVENYSTSAIIHCVQNLVQQCKADPENDKAYSLSKLLLNAIKKSPNKDAYKDILVDLEQSAAKY